MFLQLEYMILPGMRMVLLFKRPISARWVVLSIVTWVETPLTVARTRQQVVDSVCECRRESR